MKTYFLLIILCMFTFSCKDKTEERIESLVQEWQGKEIKFPDNPIFTQYVKDTVDYQIPASDYKVVMYVDSIGCVSCKLQLPRWKEFIDQVDSVCNKGVPFLFFFQPKDNQELRRILRIDNFSLPVCIDTEDRFNKLNHFPSEMMFQTFLLDKDNKIVAMGNPIHNPRVKDLYLKIIQGENASTGTVKPMTTASIDRTSMDMGKFDWQQEQTATFTVANTGDKPLAIEMVDTSCGCITVDYNQEPVRPDGSVALHVTYKAEQPEYFSKTVTVYCNAEGAPIRLTVSGNAK